MGTPIIVSFRGERKERKKDAKEAYMYLITRFLQQKPDIFDLYIKSGDKRLDFAHSPEALFPASPHLADQGGAWGHIRGSNWYANTHTQTKEKVDRLRKLADIGGFIRDVDWTWEER
jgi:hypothetical protein